MKIFGPTLKWIQRMLYDYKYGDWHLENAIYFEQFPSFKQEQLSVDEYTTNLKNCIA